VLRRDRFRCVICEADVSRPGAARVDHIKPLKQHPELAFELSNLRTLCGKCDNQSHREKGNRARVRRSLFTAIDKSGRPLDPNHHWNKE
jgi:5-methylcytosine-specific restriction enzyme A